MLHPGLHTNLPIAVSPPLFLLNSEFEVMYQSDSAIAFFGEVAFGAEISSLVSILREEVDDNPAPLMELLEHVVSSKQKITTANGVITSFVSQPPRYQNGSIEVVPFVDKRGDINQFLVQFRFTDDIDALLQELNKARKQVDVMERVSESGCWELDLVANKLAWSDGVFVLCEYEPREFEVNFETGLGAVHPDDRDYAISALQETLETGKEYYIRKRLLTKSGGVKHVISRADVIKDEEGRPVKLVGVFINRTQEQEYFEELLRQQTKEDTLINSTDDLIWSVDTSFHIISCNNAFREMVEKITGTKPNQGNYALSKIFGHEELKKWRVYYERALNGEKFSVKEDVIDANGELINSRIISITPLLNHANTIWGVACFGKEITAETKANKALERTNSELQTILTSSIDIICTIDESGIFQTVNSASLKILQYQPEELINVVFSAFVHPDDLAKTTEAVNTVMNGKDIAYFENRCLRKDGSPVSMIWSGKWDAKTRRIYCVGKDATEIQLAKQNLQESEKRFRSLVENNAGAIGILLPDGSASYATPSIQAVLGYTEQEALTLNMFELIHPEDVEKTTAKLAEALERPGVPIQNPVSRVKHKDGTWRWIAATFTNLIHEPYIGGIVNNFRDVTARVQDELQLKLLIDNTEEGFILIDKSLTIVSFNRQFEILYRKYFNISIQKGENILAYAQPERREFLASLYSRVLSGDQEMSEINIPDPEGGTRTFSLTYKPAINRAGEIEGAFVSTADITEKRRNEQQSKEYQYFIETAIENLPIGIAVNRTEDNAAILMNKTFSDVYGWPREELTDVSSFFKKVYPDEEYRNIISKRVMDDILSGDPKRMNWEGITITTQTGEKRIINAKNIPVLDQNLMISTVVDVTERERNLQRIKDSERKLLAAQRLAKLGNWQLNLATREFEWSDEVYNIWGQNKETFKPTLDTFLETMHPEDRPLFENDKEAVRNGDRQLDLEHRILLPDGTLKWVHEKATLVKDESGNPKTLEGSVQDITVEKMLSLSLEESNQRYHYATQATFDAIWDWDIVKNTIYRGENYQFLFGYSREELIASSDSWAKHIHPDDREAIVRSVKDSVNGNQSKWVGEYRYEQHDGSYAFVNDRGIIVRDRNGKAIRMVGAMQDITKQKAEEARLKLLESVITNTNDAVLITEAEPLDDPGPKIIYVNEAFTRMTGYTAEEVIGKSPRILQGPESDYEELQKLGNALRNWQPYEITTLNYKKNGEPFWINFTVTPVADEKGWFTHWIAVERDVTKIKHAEQELQKAYDEKLKYIENIEEKNKRLSEIAWIQSHIVRAPVARIMGIVDVLTDCEVDPFETKQLLNHLLRSAEDLDKIIRDIADKTAETNL